MHRVWPYALTLLPNLQVSAPQHTIGHHRRPQHMGLDETA